MSAPPDFVLRAGATTVGAVSHRRLGCRSDVTVHRQGRRPDRCRGGTLEAWPSARARVRLPTRGSSPPSHRQAAPPRRTRPDTSVHERADGRILHARNRPYRSGQGQPILPAKAAVRACTVHRATRNKAWCRQGRACCDRKSRVGQERSYQRPATSCQPEFASWRLAAGSCSRSFFPGLEVLGLFFCQCL